MLEQHFCTKWRIILRKLNYLLPLYLFQNSSTYYGWWLVYGLYVTETIVSRPFVTDIYILFTCFSIFLSSSHSLYTNERFYL
jgi:hypothetical protein